MRRRIFARAGRRSAGLRILLAVLACVAALTLVAAGTMALAGREIATRVIRAAAGHAGLAADRLDVQRVGLAGITLGAVQLGGPQGPAASSIEVGWSLRSVLRGRVGRVRIDGLTVNAAIEQGEFVIVGLPRGGDSGGGMVALAVEQVDLVGATLTVAGTTGVKARFDATLVPLDSGALVGRAAVEAVVAPAQAQPIRVTADLPEWRLTQDDAGLQFAVTGAGFLIPEHRVAVSAIDARVETGPHLSAHITGAIRDETEPARVAPIAFTVQARREQDAVTASGRVATAQEEIAATLAARHALSSGEGTMEFAIAPIKFAAGEAQPADLFPVIGAAVREVQGAVSAKGTLAWGRAFTSNAVLTLDRVGFEAGVAQVSDMSGTVRLASLMPPRTAGSQRIAANIHAAGLPPMPLDLRFGVAGESLHIDAATLGFAGGTLGLADVTLAAGKPADATLTVRAVDLGAVLGLLDIDGLSGTGTIEGAIPIRVDPSGAALRSGQLVGIVPGVMRYAGTGLPQPAPDAPATDPIRLMRAALADFHYTGLKLTLERATSGEGSLLINLQGANPQVLDNHPFAFNIRLDANFDKIAAILFEGYAAADELIRRSRRP
jgi:hypothetical protein